MDGKDFSLFPCHTTQCLTAQCRKKHRALTSADPDAATELAKSASFSSDTYATYLEINEGFFTLLSNLTRGRPSAVHEALDLYVHLVWFKFTAQAPLMASLSGLPSTSVSTSQIKWNYVLDNVSFSVHEYAKRFDPVLPVEIRSFAGFISSSRPSEDKLSLSSNKETGRLSDDALHLVSHFQAILPRIAAASEPCKIDKRPPTHEFCNNPCCDTPPSFNTDPIFELFRSHPGLSSPELPHPALPILCLIVQLLNDSRFILPELITSGTTEWSILECLRRLWARHFYLPHDYRFGTWEGSGAGPGKWVSTEKRTYAMRLVTCLTVASMIKAAILNNNGSQDWPGMELLTEQLTATPELQSWTWDVISASLCSQGHFSKLISAALNAEVPLTKVQKESQRIHHIYAEALGHVEYLVQYLSTHQQRPPSTPKTDKFVPVEKLVLIFEDVYAYSSILN